LEAQAGDDRHPKATFSTLRKVGPPPYFPGSIHETPMSSTTRTTSSSTIGRREPHVGEMREGTTYNHNVSSGEENHSEEKQGRKLRLTPRRKKGGNCSRQGKEISQTFQKTEKSIAWTKRTSRTKKGWAWRGSWGSWAVRRTAGKNARGGGGRTSRQR